MRYLVTLPGQPSVAPVAVDIGERAGGGVSAKVGGRDVDVDVARLGGQWSVRIGGRILDLTMRGDPTQLAVVASGLRAAVRVEAESGHARGVAPSRKGPAEHVVRSPMPGRVLRVAVKQGDTVSAGQTLAVVEAMKMENEVRASIDGVVRAVHVEVAAAIENGAPLVTIGS